jgi:hypothetical protein
LKNQLVGTGVPYSNDELTLQLLCALQKFYKSFVSLVGNQPNLTFDQLCQALKNEEIILGGTSSNLTTALMAIIKIISQRCHTKHNEEKKLNLII